MGKKRLFVGMTMMIALLFTHHAPRTTHHVFPSSHGVVR